MVCVKLVCLALIASLCEVSVGQCLRRVRPSCPGPSRGTPCLPPPAPCRANINKINGAYIYESKLEGIISKLVNALIYTSIYKCSTGSTESGGSGASTGGGTGGGNSGGTGSTGSGSGNVGGGNNGSGGSGSGGSGGTLDRLLTSLLSVDLALGDTDVLNVDVLGGKRSGGSSGGGSGSIVSGGTDGAASKGSDDLLNKIYNSLLKLEVALGKQEVVGGGGSGNGEGAGRGSDGGGGGRGGLAGGGAGGKLDGLLDLLNLDLSLGNTDVLDLSVLGDGSGGGYLDRDILSLLLLGGIQGPRSE